MFRRMCEIIQILGAGGLVAVPSHAELGGPVAAEVEKYDQPDWVFLLSGSDYR
jgi:hypothetical protein